MDEQELAIKNAMDMLEQQIEQQKKLVELLLAHKQLKIQREKDNILQLRSLVQQQNNEEKKITNQINKQNSKKNNKKINEISNISKSKVSKPTQEFTQANIKKQQDLLLKKSASNTQFHKLIIKKRQKYFYKNRKFFHGYKFVQLLNGRELALVSTEHEITKVPLIDACSLPVSIKIGNDSYIKNINGDYFIESLSSKKLKLHAIKESNEPCVYYSKTGKCPNMNCKFVHDHEKVALCPNILKRGHTCSDPSCTLSHSPNEYNSPSCKFFLSNICRDKNCPFSHKSENSNSPICREFANLGYCINGLNCKFIHSFDCPDIKEYGRCFRGKNCRCIHNKLLQRIQPNDNSNNSNIVNNGLSNKNKIISNNDNNKVIQIVYDDADDDDDEQGNNNSNNDNDNSEMERANREQTQGSKPNEDEGNDNGDENLDSDESDDNVDIIIGPLGNGLSKNDNFVPI